MRQRGWVTAIGWFLRFGGVKLHPRSGENDRPQGYLVIAGYQYLVRTIAYSLQEWY